jgi:putative tricarboxylic transport membrane protein
MCYDRFMTGMRADIMKPSNRFKMLYAIRSAMLFVLGVMPVVSASAADWKPEKNIEIVVGVTPGGPADTSARMLQRIMQEKRMVAVPVSVTNRPGANNALAWLYINQHAGDGHYLAMTLPNIVTNRLTGTHELNYAEVTPLAQLNSEYIVFSVKSDSPLKTGLDLLNRLRSDPASQSIAFSNIGSANHIGAGLVMHTAGLPVKKLKLVAFKGASEAVVALLGGHVDAVASSASTVAPQIQSGALRIIAVAAPQRLKAYAQVPTWKEQGVNAAFANWRGIVGPKNLTPAQIAFWDDLLGKAVRTEEWIKEVEKFGWEPDYKNSTESRKFLERQNEELKALLAELGLSK